MQGATNLISIPTIFFHFLFTSLVPFPSSPPCLPIFFSFFPFPSSLPLFFPLPLPSSLSLLLLLAVPLPQGEGGGKKYLSNYPFFPIYRIYSIYLNNDMCRPSPAASSTRPTSTQTSRTGMPSWPGLLRYLSAMSFIACATSLWATQSVKPQCLSVF